MRGSAELRHLRGAPICLKCKQAEKTKVRQWADEDDNDEVTKVCVSCADIWSGIFKNAKPEISNLKAKFNLRAKIYEVTPYSEMYEGVHPRTFVFDRSGAKIILPKKSRGTASRKQYDRREIQHMAGRHGLKEEHELSGFDEAVTEAGRCGHARPRAVPRSQRIVQPPARLTLRLKGLMREPVLR